jgi:hypothetical protein
VHEGRGEVARMLLDHGAGIEAVDEAHPGPPCTRPSRPDGARRSQCC